MKVQMTVWGVVIAATLAAVGCKMPGAHNLPPAQQLMHPGPGVGGPGPGVMLRGNPGSQVQQASYEGVGPAGYGGPVGPGCFAGYGGPGSPATSQLAFVGPDGMAVSWDISQAGMFDSEPLIVPGRQNFGQAAIYRIKLTNIPGRPGVELYPTLEVGPATPRTDAYLAHNSIPVQFTEEDLDQVLSGNFVTKVIYLPDPEFQELALAGVETLVSTRLDPGVDPIVEADRRGAILAIIRVGNKDLQVPGGAFDGQVLPAGYAAGVAGAPGAPIGAPTAEFAPGAYPPSWVSGVTTPNWGMPISGTPIGLPGPPHVPLGVPAGLQKHVMRNHTVTRMPEPVKDFRIDVTQRPGFSYPNPVSNVSIGEDVNAPATMFHAPHGSGHVKVLDHPAGCGCQECQ
jgi:hypothetical protein